MRPSANVVASIAAALFCVGGFTQAQAPADDDVTKPAGAVRSSASDAKLVEAEKRIADLEAKVRALESVLADRPVAAEAAETRPSPATNFFAVTPDAAPTSGDSAPVDIIVELAPAPRVEPLDPFANPQELMQEIEHRYVERFGSTAPASIGSAPALDSFGEEVSLWVSRQNALLSQPVDWLVRVVRVEPSRTTASRVVVVCRGLAADQASELSNDFRVELDGESTRALLREHPPTAAFRVKGTFDPELAFSADHAEAGPWHRSGHFVGPFCVSKWTVIGDSLERAEAPVADASPEVAPTPEENPAEPTPSEPAPEVAPEEPAAPTEEEPEPMAMPEDTAASDAAAEAAGVAARAAAEAEAEVEAARAAAEEENARLAAAAQAEADAARLAAEEETARLAAAEAEAARVAAEEETARLAAAEAEAARVAAEEETARLAAAEAEAARVAAEEETARLAAAEAEAARVAAEEETARLAAAAQAEAEARARDPLANLSTNGRKMVDRSTSQLAQTTDAATVAQLVKGYESRLKSANADIKPAIEVMLNNARTRLDQLNSSGQAPTVAPTDPSKDAATASTPK